MTIMEFQARQALPPEMQISEAIQSSMAQFALAVI